MKRLVMAGAAVLLCATNAGASSPDTSTINVPASGPVKVSATWTGTTPVASVALSFQDCSTGFEGAGAGTQFSDVHKIHVAVPPAAYNVVNAKLTLTVDTDFPDSAFDYIELQNPAGAVIGKDQQKAEMTIEVANPAPGDYTSLVCSWLPYGDVHPYSATIAIKTTCKGVSPCSAAKPTARRTRKK